ncbi:MAG: protein kinase [Gemmatimonadetes bacterium]|nr:protein kinase [Gemmatimonadota bacterium]
MTDDASAAEALRRRVEEAVGGIFEVEDEIGRGGMAVVYRALDKRLRRHVALKVLPPELAFRADVRSRFVREAQLAAQLSHPNIVPIYGVDETGGLVYFAMGLVDGESLAKLLSHDPHPPLAEVRRLLREVADGLAYAHGRGVVHRDIKPDNILVDRSTGRALVTDFGIARAAEGDLKLTATGVAVGTPAYMSPEQAMGEKEVDGRADIYALGVVGWQLLAGELPFQSKNTPGMLMKHISEPPRSLNGLRDNLPSNLVYAIERAMAKSRDDRWPDATAFRDALADDAHVPESAFSNSETPPDSMIPWRAAAADRGQEPRELCGPSSAKPWRFDPMRDPALASNSGAHALREWREQRQAWRAQRNKPAPIDDEPLSRHQRRQLARDERRSMRTPEDRIRATQRAIVGMVLTGGSLAVINMLTSPQFPWFIFPVVGMGIGVMSRISSLWVDGISIGRLFRRQPRGEGDSAADAAGNARAPRRSAFGRKREPARIAAPDLSGVPRELLDGRYGATIRDAAEAKHVIADVMARLTPDESLMLPDVRGTAAALEERIRGLASALHQLDRDASPGALRSIEMRIADARAGAGDNVERERRVGLLERQHTTLKDLAERRATVADQLEGASILLQTMKLDLLKLRSSGVESRLADSTMATQEARAVATDIERLVDAANEVREL